MTPYFSESEYVPKLRVFEALIATGTPLVSSTLGILD